MINNILLRIKCLKKDWLRLLDEIKTLNPKADMYHFEKGLKRGQILSIKSELENLGNLLREANFRRDNNMDRFTDGPDYRIPMIASEPTDCTLDLQQKAYDYIYEFWEQHGYTPAFDYVCDMTEIHQDIVFDAFQEWEAEEKREVQKQQVVLREVG